MSSGATGGGGVSVVLMLKSNKLDDDLIDYLLSDRMYRMVLYTDIHAMRFNSGRVWIIFVYNFYETNYSLNSFFFVYLRGF